MPITVANLIPTTPPAPTGELATARQTSRTGSSEPFQTVLAEASAETRSAQVTVQAAGEAEAAATFAEDEVTDDEADEALAAELAGVLVAAQFGVPNNTPVALTEVIATGQLTPDALNGEAPEVAPNPTGVPTRSNPLFRQFVSEAATQNNTRLAASVTRDTLPEPTPPAAVLPQPAIVPTVPEPQPQPAVTGLPAAVAAVQPTQRQIVPAQAPIVAGLLPPPVPGVTEAPSPVVAPQSPIEVGALPDARIGDRPGTAGEQFAAIASAASTLPTLSNTGPAPVEFAAVTSAPAPTVAEPAPTANPALAPSAPPAPTTNAPAPATLTANALAPTAPNADAVAPRTATVPAPQTPLPSPNALATTPAESNTATATTVILPVTTRTIEPSESVPESQFGDAPRLSGFGGLPAPLSPTAPDAPRAATATQPPAPAVQVADGIITHAHVIERAGTTEFQIRLDPPELGPVRIRLSHSGDGINGQVVVSDDAIRRMIESQLPELRQRLEAAGVELQRFDVSTDTNTGGGRNAYRSEGPPGFGPPGATATGSAPRASPARRAAGVLDVMA